MLLNSVIIVLREVTEAALIFSILIALSKTMGFNLKWIAFYLLLGMIGATLYAMNINSISQWFNGMGQELTNALFQISIYITLIIYLSVLTRYIYINQVSISLLVFLLSIIITLAITR